MLNRSKAEANGERFLNIYLNEQLIGQVLGASCFERRPYLRLSSEQFSTLVPDGYAEFRIETTAGICSGLTDDPGFVRIGLEYPAPGRRADCNLNGILDDCELANPGNDCDSDGLLDTCEIDCDGNGLPDAYELEMGLANDCDDDGVPDACQLADGSATDIDNDGRLDRCQLDCHDNGLPDSFEFEQGSVTDCNANGIPDECDLPRHRSVRSRQFDYAESPSGQRVLLQWQTLPADTDVVIRSIATRGRSGDVRLELNGVPVGSATLTGPGNCQRQEGVCLIAAATFNQLLGPTGAARLVIETDGELLCEEIDTARLEFEVAYQAGSGSEDCNADGIPDECQLGGAVADLNGNGRADACEPDCDGSGVADAIEIADGSVPDCNGNGVPDSCDISATYTSPWIELTPGIDRVSTYLLRDVPPPVGDGVLTVEAEGDLGPTDVRFSFDGRPLVQSDGMGDCQLRVRTDNVSESWLRSAASDGEIEVQVTTEFPTEECASGRLAFQLSYATSIDTDCDSNERPDTCDLDPNRDCNGDGLLDACDDTVAALDLRLFRQQFDVISTGLAVDFGLYEFAGGETGDQLVDDGAATYIAGNRIYTPDQDRIPYTGGEIVSGEPGFGPGSSYLTRKRPGIFALVTANASATELEIDGALQPSDAAPQKLGFHLEADGRDYTVFVKHFVNMTTPNPHHIYIFPGTWDFSGDSGPVSLLVSSDAERDQSRLRGPRVDNEPNLTYLLVLTADGEPLRTDQLASLVTRVLASVHGSDFDCDDNGVLDVCDIDADPGLDVDGNGLLDGCEPDCNGNGLPDACDIGVTSDDCNVNGIPDECDAADPNVDCNGNGVPDRCDVPQVFRTDRFEPLVPGESIVTTLSGLPPASGPVTLSGFARGNFLNNNRLVELWINGVLVREWFDEELGQCQVEREDFELPAAEYNELVRDGVAEIEFIPRRTGSCSVSWVRLTIDYGVESVSEDCNGNLVPDECDLEQGLDFNNNGIVDDCGDCLGDTDGNGSIGQPELSAVLTNFGTQTGATLEMGDVDGDGDVDLSDLGFVLAVFGQDC